MSKKQRVDYGRYGFDQYQITDLQIIMNLETKEDMREFAETVGPEDVQYSMSLLETLALAVLDEETESMTEFPSDILITNINENTTSISIKHSTQFCEGLNNLENGNKIVIRKEGKKYEINGKSIGIK